MPRLLTYSAESGTAICDSTGFVTVSLGGEYNETPIVCVVTSGTHIGSSGSLHNTGPGSGGGFMQDDDNTNAFIVSSTKTSGQWSVIMGTSVSGSAINYTAWGTRLRG